jgi:hypothetical protein
VGTLITDFYAVYDAIDCRKQRCLVHLLRALHDLKEKTTRHYVREYVEPLIRLFQEAIALGHARETLTADAYQAACRKIETRLDGLIFTRPRHPECRRINRRLVRYRGELLTFLEQSHVPADNNGMERDARSVAAIRSDGGVNRSESGATAFARIKSVIRTCQKNARNFFAYGLDLVRATLSGSPPPLPLTPDTG